MKGLRKVLYVFWGQFLESLTSKRVWIGYLISIVLSLKMAYQYCGYAYERVIQIFEPGIINLMGLGNVLLLLIGYVFIVSDAPFVNHRSTMALYRTSRTQWFYGMSLYISVHGILYYLVGLLTTCIYSMSRAFTNNLWSRPMRHLALYPSQEAFEKWGMPKLGNDIILTQFNPLSAIVQQLLLIIIYNILLALVILIFNTVFNKAVGTAIAAAIYVVGYILMVDSPFSQWSLFYNSMFRSHLHENPEIFKAVIYLLILPVILLIIGPLLIRHADFRHTAGDSNE